MSNPTAPAAARPASAPSLFVPEGGCTWIPVPVGLDGPGLLVWMALLRCRRGVLVTAPDRVLAALCKRSTRYVQLGLRQLESENLIRRTRRHGGRVVAILVRLAGREIPAAPRKVQESHTASTDRKSAPPPIRTTVSPPSYGGEKGVRTCAPSGPATRPAGAPEGRDPAPVDWRALLPRLPAVAARLARLAAPG